MALQDRPDDSFPGDKVLVLVQRVNLSGGLQYVGTLPVPKYPPPLSIQGREKMMGLWKRREISTLFLASVI